MANIMNLKNIKNNVHRSGFDMSRRVMFTAKVGEILPVHWQEVLPGDSFEIDLNSFGRTAPLDTASFGRVREYYDVYFVPYRLLWKHFPQWITQTGQSDVAISLDNQMAEPLHSPYLTDNGLYRYFDERNNKELDSGGMNALASSSKLLSYLGYKVPSLDNPKPTSPRAWSLFPVAAYQKIYNDYFRFEQWESSAPWCWNFDYALLDGSGSRGVDLSTQIGDVAQVEGDNIFSMRYCNYDKDYFNGILPSAQFGDESIVSLVGQLSGPSSFSELTFRLPSSGDDSNHLNTSFVEGANRISVLGSPREIGLGDGTVNFAAHDGRENLLFQSFGILALRRAECLQKWKEITLSGDYDYRAQLAKHWNVSVPESLSGKCQYLGGCVNNLDVSEVINTNLTEGNSADIQGKGITSCGGHVRFNNPGNDYGILMVMYHAKPLIEWNGDDVVHKSLLKTSPTDYAIPEFDSIGMESVFNYEFAYNTGDQFTNTFAVGYAPRYVEYKTSYDVALGEFQKSLKSWILPYSALPFDSKVGFSYLNFKVRPNIVDNMFGVAADDTTATDHFYNSLFLSIRPVRNLSRDGLPY